MKNKRNSFWNSSSDGRFSRAYTANRGGGTILYAVRSRGGGGGGDRGSGLSLYLGFCNKRLCRPRRDDEWRASKLYSYLLRRRGPSDLCPIIRCDDIVIIVITIITIALRLVHCGLRVIIAQAAQRFSTASSSSLSPLAKTHRHRRRRVWGRESGHALR